MRPASSPRVRARSLLPALAYALLGGSLACGNDSTGPSGPQPDHIELSATSLTLRQRESVQVIPSVVDKDGTLLSGVGVKFRSSDEAVVTVSNVGVVTASGRAGNATVTATAGKVHADLPVTVTAVSNGIVVTPSPATVLQKGTLALSAKVTDLSGEPISGAAIQYATSNPAIVTVSPTGLITSVGPAGSAVITLTHDTLSATVPVSVPQVPTSISAPGTISLARNTTGGVSARLLDAVGTVIPNAVFTYTSDNGAVVSVGSDGVLHAGTTLGTANVTVHAGALSAVVRVSVVNAGHPLAGEIVARSPVTVGTWSVAISSSGVVFAGMDGLARGDISTYTMTPILTRTGEYMLDIAFNASGTTAYVSGLAGTQLTAIDVARNSVLWSVPVTATPYAVALAPDERTVYMSAANGTVYAIDVATRSVAATIQVGGAPNHLVASRATGKLYANDFLGASVSEIDMTTNTVVRKISLPSSTPQMMAVSPDGGTLYVANEAGGLLVVDLAAGTATMPIPNANGAFGLAMSPDGLQLYSTTSYGGTVSIIDVQSRTVVKSLSLGAEGRRIAFSADGLTAAIASGGAVVFIR